MSSIIQLLSRRPAFAAACLLVLFASAGPARAAAAGLMPLGPATAPPAAFLAFCRAAPARCGADARQVALAEVQAPALGLGAALTRFLPAGPVAAPAPVTARPEHWRTIVRINRDVNRRLRAAPDLADEWSLPLAEGRADGDCEDYALEKARALAAAGVPGEALSLAVARTPQGYGHAVLLVETEAGPKVLDNLTSEIRDWRATPYLWTMRQVPGRPLEWRAITAG